MITTGKGITGLGRPLLVCVLGISLFGCSNGFREVTKTAPANELIHVAALSGESAGFAVGYGGTVQYTTDGGKTWTAGVNRSMCQFSLYSLDDKTCYAAGNGSHVIMTKDGGKLWTHLANIPNGRAKGISFANGSDGWVWTKTALYSTRNGGKTWQTVALPPGCTILESAYLQSVGNGFLCGLDGYIHRTRDGGRTWERTIQFLDTKDQTFKAVLAGGVQGTAIRFSGEQGIAAVIGLKNGKAAIRILRTSDDGENWSEPEFHLTDLPAKTITISPEMKIAQFNSDSTVSMFALK